MEATQRTAEAIYVDAYGVVSEYADFAQLDNSVDLFLPPEFIELLTTTAITSLLTGALTGVGERLARKIKKVRGPKGTLDSMDRDNLIQEIRRCIEEENMDASSVVKATDEVRKRLVDAGLTQSAAEAIAGEIVEAARKNLDS